MSNSLTAVDVVMRTSGRGVTSATEFVSNFTSEECVELVERYLVVDNVRQYMEQTRLAADQRQLDANNESDIDADEDLLVDSDAAVDLFHS